MLQFAKKLTRHPKAVGWHEALSSDKTGFKFWNRYWYFGGRFVKKNIMIWGCYHSSIVLVQGLAVDIQLVEIVLFMCWSAHRLPLSFCYAMTGLNSFTADTSISCLINLRWQGWEDDCSPPLTMRTIATISDN